ncbi:response regulator [Cytobacillus purgationiresistens]|uniref:Two-component system CitB family response regulator n=1 Tax=Cytobacillus purgationiresistens TaxID=863449 RepID=A0ABU0ARI1_9BACI|nr:response regulator [Cytobacillus purgationiresistens]MDQ0272660.1 two-component system CitB family response regulator [Cytobacillus purgationiresistens]
MRDGRVIEVLIVEDDLRIAEIQRQYIENIDGFKTIGIATSHFEAKKFMDVFQPDLILLDVYFPDMNGIDLLKEIKQQDKQMGVIMITAARELVRVQEAITIGVFDYMIKPVVFDRFKQSLARYQDFHYQLLDSKGNAFPLTQQQVDKLLQKEKRSTDKEKEEKSMVQLPKGIDRLTLEKVLGVLGNTEQQGLTAEIIAVEIGVSRTTARRYLEYLMFEEKVDADLSYGQVGRPERVYSVRK